MCRNTVIECNDACNVVRMTVRGRFLIVMLVTMDVAGGFLT